MIKDEDLQIGAVYEFSDYEGFPNDGTVTNKLESRLPDGYVTYNGGSWRYIRYCQAPIAKPKHVFTQEMADRNELPPVGSEFIALYGSEKPVTSIGHYGGMVVYSWGGGYSAASAESCKPIKPDREKVINHCVECVATEDDIMRNVLKEAVTKLVEADLINEDKILKRGLAGIDGNFL